MASERVNAMKRLLCCALLLPGLLQAQEPQNNDDDKVANNYSRLIFEAELLAAPVESTTPDTNTADAGDTGTADAAADADDSSPDDSAVNTTASTGAGGAANTNSSSASGADTAGGQTADRVDTSEIERYERDINETAGREGLYSIGLREQYVSLGELYQKNNEHENAIKAFEDAMHIDRVNEGLFTEKQIPLVENIIESYTAMADFDAVNDQQAYLYYVNQRAYAADDPRLLAAKENWADWNVESYLKQGVTDSGRFDPMSLTRPTNTLDGGYVAVKNPANGNLVYVPRNQMMNVMSNAATVNDLYNRSTMFAVPPEQVVDERLRTAKDLYKEIVESPNKEYLASRQSLVEHKLANVAYAAKQQLDALENSVDENSLMFNRVMNAPPPNPVVTRGYSDSREMLEALAKKLDDDANSTPAQVAQAYLNLGDWHLAYDRVQRSRESYERALAVLNEAGTAPADISAIVNPKPLIPVPGFALHPYSREFYAVPADAALEYDGYIDINLRINQAGDIRSSRITNVSPDTPQRIRNVLLDFLRSHKMRPLVQDGKLVKESELSLRIHYSF